MSFQTNIEYLDDPLPTPVLPVSPTLVQGPPVDDEIGEKGNPTLLFQGYEIDQDTAIVVAVLVTIWVLVWRTTGVYKTLRHDILFSVIFVAFTIYLMTALVTSGHSSGSISYELNILLSVEQMVALLFSLVVVFTLFSYKLEVHASCSPVIKRINLAMLVLLSMTSLWVAIGNNARAFRGIRKFKQGMYNIVLIMFMVCALIILRGGECELPKTFS
jgi:hypothetical protein